MGRTKRMGPRPPLTRAEIKYDTMDTLKLLKNHKDEPIYSVIDRLIEERENHPGVKRLHTRLTTFCADLDKILGELYEKGITLECVKDLDEHTQVSIRSFLKSVSSTTT